MTDWFVYEAWGLVTPFMNGKGFTGDVKIVNPNMSLCTNAMYHSLYNAHNQTQKNPFSFETLQNIVRTGYDRMLEYEELHPDDRGKIMPWSIISTLKGMERKDFEEKLSSYKWVNKMVEIMEYEDAEAGDSHPSDYPIHNLFAGVFLDYNWEWLSDDDFWEIAACYGANRVSDTKITALQLILNTQNALVTELLIRGYKETFSIRGVDNLTPLLQDALNRDMFPVSRSESGKPLSCSSGVKLPTNDVSPTLEPSLPLPILEPSPSIQ